MDLSKQKAYIAALAYAVIVGLSFLGTKTCLEVTSPLLTLTWRYNIGFLGGILLIFIGVVKINFAGKSMKGLLFASFFYIAFMGIQTYGLTKATSIEGSIVFAIVPIFVQGIAYVLLKEKTVLVQNLFILLSIAGVVIMYVWGSAGLVDLNPIGFLILLISSLCMAFSNVFMRYARKDFKAMEVGCFIAFLGFVVFNVALLISSAVQGVYGLSYYISPFTSSMGGKFAIAIIYLGIPCMLLTSTLITYALSHMEAVKGTVVGNLSLLIAIIAGIIIRNEPFLVYHFICSALIIIGVIGTNIPKMKMKEPKESIEENT